MIILQLLVLITIIAILANFIHKRRNKRFYQLLEQFPAHRTYPLIGNAHMLMGFSEGVLDRFEKVLQPYDRVAFWIGPKPCLFIRNHNDIATILNLCHDRDTLNIGDEWLGEGLLSGGYKQWKTSKKMMSPGFHSDILLKYVDVFNRNASYVVNILKPFADAGKQIDVFHFMMMTSLDSMAETTLGIKIREKSGEDFCNSVTEGFKHGTRRIQWPFLLHRIVNTIYLKMTAKLKVINHVKYVTAKVLKEKLEKFGDIQNQCGTIEKENVDSPETIIDSIIRNKFVNEFPETRIINELAQMMIAGIKPTAHTMSFLMLMLAMNQDAQQKVYEEIVKLVPDDEIITETHLTNHLEYLEQCIQETIRMFSPLMLTCRRTHKEILLPNNTIVPKNIYVVTFVHFANHDPDLYKNPDKWDPENYTNEAVKQRPKTSQLNFGSGPRSCMGIRYAMMAMKTQIVYILRNYHLSTSIKEFTKHHLTAELGIKSKIGYPVQFTSRRNK